MKLIRRKYQIERVLNQLIHVKWGSFLIDDWDARNKTSTSPLELKYSRTESLMEFIKVAVIGEI